MTITPSAGGFDEVGTLVFEEEDTKYETCSNCVVLRKNCSVNQLTGTLTLRTLLHASCGKQTERCEYRYGDRPRFHRPIRFHVHGRSDHHSNKHDPRGERRKLVLRSVRHRFVHYRRWLRAHGRAGTTFLAIIPTDRTTSSDRWREKARPNLEPYLRCPGPEPTTKVWRLVSISVNSVASIPSVKTLFVVVMAGWCSACKSYMNEYLCNEGGFIDQLKDLSAGIPVCGG